MSSLRSSSSSNTARSSARASMAPRQWCGPPPPNATCGLGWRAMSNLNGASKTSSSRFAERNIDTTRSPLGMCDRPSRCRLWRCGSSTPPAKTSAAPLRRRWTARLVFAVPLDLLRVGDERLQPDGQRVLGGVAAGEREHEEEELEFVGGQAELLAVVTGDDRGRQRAPDVVGGVSPLFGGEFHRVTEDRARRVESLCRFESSPATGLQDAVQRRRCEADPRRVCR